MSKPKRVMKEMYLEEISAVDRPAQAGARATIMKRAPKLEPEEGESKEMFVARVMASEEMQVDFLDQVQRLAAAEAMWGERTAKRIALTNAVAGHSHSLLTNLEGGEVNRGKTSWAEGHDHDWIMDEAGNILIGDSMGHNHGLAALVMKQDGGGALATLVVEKIASATKAADSGNKESPMTPEEKAAVEKAQNDAKAAQQVLEKRLARAEKLSELNDAQRALFVKMSAEQQDEFLALKPEDRQAQVTKVADENPVVETIDGMSFRKNDDPRLLAMAKSARKDRDERETAQKALKAEGLRKRAEDLSHLPGDVDTRIALLEAVDTIPVEKREKVLEILKSHDAGLAAAFAKQGAKGSPKDGTPEAKIEAIAKSLRDKNPKLSAEQAMVAALETPEGQAAYNQHVGA